MSILLAIGKSHEDRQSRRAASAEREETDPFFGGWDGPEAASAASRGNPADGERCVNPAEPG
jgi:hypothetical protein